ncbi:ABC transporter substrate-binding protein [candidate division KSB3 bacterium]|uniref:ABC transporter substrate-binding protein n=1 Tax=candidate division KSB3 bacterium TaxID=2044937 RepID=A0A2G6KB12_9BACT|nr:MAG: ABC transporter substrate-binding protein [candidate division KSB3 bacterium]
MQRRDVLKAGISATSALMVGGAPAVHAGTHYEWKMVTAWPKNLLGLGEGAKHLARTIKSMSGGRISITIYWDGELVPAFESFHAVSTGKAEMGHAAAYYWADIHEAAQFFAAIPFGLNAQETAGWLYYGGGQELWNELYAQYNLQPFAAGSTGVQMGGWFNTGIQSIDDYKGLTIRMPGLGGKVISHAGAQAINLPGGEILAALESGAIDASEWVGPYNDLAFELYKAARYYYWPGWHEPSTVIECFINKYVYESLPLDLRQIVTYAMQAAYNDMLSFYTAQNNLALIELVTKHHVRLRKFKKATLARLGKLSKEVITDIAAKDPFSQKVYTSFDKFRKQSVDWNSVGEEGYSVARSLTYSPLSRRWK